MEGHVFIVVLTGCRTPTALILLHRWLSSIPRRSLQRLSAECDLLTNQRTRKAWKIAISIVRPLELPPSNSTGSLLCFSQRNVKQMVMFDQLPINDARTRTNDKLILTNAERKRLSNGDPRNLPGSRAPQMIKSQSTLSISSATRRDRPGTGPCRLEAHSSIRLRKIRPRTCMWYKSLWRTD